MTGGKRIRYATGIEYFEGSLTLPGSAREVWKESSDNPMSPTFKPLAARHPNDQARWWALYNRRRQQQPAAGVFE